MALLKTTLQWLGTTLILGSGVLFALLGLGAELKLVEARNLMAAGAASEATVTGKRAGGKRSSRHDFSYEIRVGDRRFERTVTGIGFRDYEALQVGGKIPAWYEPANPGKSITRAELADLESWPNRLFGPVLALALLGWGIARIVRRSRSTPAPRN